MSIAFVKKKQLTYRSEQLCREVYIDELHDLSDEELRQLRAELEAQVRYLRDDFEILPDGDTARHHVRHKMGIARGYLSQCDIEASLRSQEVAAGVEVLKTLLVARLGEANTAELFKAAGLVL